MTRRGRRDEVAPASRFDGGFELEAWAKARGVRTLRLETNRTLDEAISLYRTAGYREVAAFNDEPCAHHWFEKTIGA